MPSDIIGHRARRPLYETDLVRWAERNAEFLRSGASAESVLAQIDVVSMRKTAASSISRTYGRICSRANLRTVVWKSFSSSVSEVRGSGAASTRSIAGMSEAYSTGDDSR
jgi:hypothetical protein